ncbi:MAG: hypothetical protein JNL61_02675 [Rhizobiaceae bacterium]|nr:hypothetical protein [Rhizobiaceae bacterium]
MRTLLVVLLGLLLLGCVSAPDEPELMFAAKSGSERAVAGATKLVPDPHAGWTRVLGPLVLADDRFYGRQFVIQSWTDPVRRQRDNVFEIQISSGFPKRVFLKQAYAEGKELKTIVIDRERLDCGYDCAIKETVGIRLTEAEMADFATRDVAIEVIGRRETIVVTIPASYFAGVLSVHRQFRARLAEMVTRARRCSGATPACSRPAALRPSMQA